MRGETIAPSQGSRARNGNTKGGAGDRGRGNGASELRAREWGNWGSRRRTTDDTDDGDKFPHRLCHPWFPGDSLGSAQLFDRTRYYPETRVAQPIGGSVAESRRRSADLGAIVSTSAAKYAESAREGTDGIVQWRFHVMLPAQPVRTPLDDVAVHVDHHHPLVFGLRDLVHSQIIRNPLPASKRGA